MAISEILRERLQPPTLATLGFVHVPPAPVEAVIALSILFVAYEVLRKNENPSGLAQRKPWRRDKSANGPRGSAFRE
jgi:hypothetical protein